MAEKEPVQAFIGFGSNMGDREEFLHKSIHLIELHPDIKVIRLSQIYETAPVGYLEQDSFLNMVAAVETYLTSRQLFAHMMEVEGQLGRKRDIRWGPRTIDLDLLLYNSEELHTEDLDVPHPRMLERAFVLIPLLEVLGQESIPGTNEDIEEIMEQLTGKEEVKLWKAPESI